MLIVDILRQELNAELAGGAKVGHIAKELDMSRLGLHKFATGKSNGNGTLIDGLWERYGYTCRQDHRKAKR